MSGVLSPHAVASLLQPPVRRTHPAARWRFELNYCGQWHVSSSSLSAHCTLPARSDMGWGMDGDDIYVPPATVHTEDSRRDTAMVAYFNKHEGPVKGLSFNSVEANILASGAMKGRVMIWDLAKSSKLSYPERECYGFSNADVSYICWNPNASKSMASSSTDGIYLWDTRANSPLVGFSESSKGFSSIQWSPSDSNTIIAGSQEQSNSASVMIFDTRNMTLPVKKFCHDSKGMLSLSWCPISDMIVGSTFNKKVLVWKGQTHEVIWEKKFDDEVSDTHWSNVNTGSFAIATQEKISLYNLDGSVGGN